MMESEHHASSEPVQDGRGLVRKVMTALPIGSVRPAGWLADQLQYQAAGLCGHLDEFWPSIRDSAWIGGSNEGWERGPYWLDGLVPIAFLLDSAPLKHKVHHWVDYILAHQRDDGWLGPVLKHKDGSDLYDTWPLYPLLKAFTQFQEATGDPRIIPAMTRLLRRVDQQISREPIFSWGRFRTSDLIVSIHWLFDRTGEAWLLQLADKVHQQGFDYVSLLEDPELFPHKQKTPPGHGGSNSTHGVNLAMGLKQAAVWYRQSHEASDREAGEKMIATLDRFHGQASGMFSCDEHLAGKMPSQGTELCTVVEFLFSLEVMLSVAGTVNLADRLEQVAFNALPAAFTPDMWAHQYDQQCNQVVCKVSPQRIYTDNGPDSNLFGLEPNYGCCTANFSQGWPKFAAHLWMATADGLAAVAYAPCDVAATVQGTQVRVQVRTNYPFEDEVRIAIDPDRPTRFPLLLRIPAWAKGATVQIGQDPPAPATAGEFHRIEQVWTPASQLLLKLPMPPRIERRFNNSITLLRGPLVLSLNIPTDWRRLRGTLPYADWEAHPKAAWNYALQLDPAHPEQSVRVQTTPPGDQPFAPESAPVRAYVKARKVEGWDEEKNAAAPPPQSPAKSSQPLEEIELIPYGAAKLRVTEFPALEQ